MGPVSPYLSYRWVVGEGVRPRNSQHLLTNGYSAHLIHFGLELGEESDRTSLRWIEAAVALPHRGWLSRRDVDFSSVGLYLVFELPSGADD